MSSGGGDPSMAVVKAIQMEQGKGGRGRGGEEEGRGRYIGRIMQRGQGREKEPQSLGPVKLPEDAGVGKENERTSGRGWGREMVKSGRKKRMRRNGEGPDRGT